jgi:hypothetical protein
MSLTEQTWCKGELFSAQRYWICIMEVFQQSESGLKVENYYSNFEIAN